MEAAFCGRKNHPTQNVMAVIDLDLRLYCLYFYEPIEFYYLCMLLKFTILLKFYYFVEIYVAEIFYLCFLKLEAMKEEVKSDGNTQWITTQPSFVQNFLIKFVTD
jgi:hypothetical protein